MAAQLVGIEKTKRLDLGSGKEMEIESPNLSRTCVTGTIEIDDAAPILMPVNYRPPGKPGEDKVWLLAARPFIWIEEEVNEIRREGGNVSPEAIWDSEVKEREKAARATPLPFNDDVKEILQAIVTDVLTNPDLKSTREFYGTKKDKTFTLVDNTDLGWPKEFKPDTHGYKLIDVPVDPFVRQRRVLGLRVDKFDLKQKKSDLFDAPIVISLFNAGGSANGASAATSAIRRVRRPSRTARRSGKCVPHASRG
jgi:hypothetical protein